ncbi:MAG: acetyl-CoA carboxylase biotin carboxyl carrier protein subunit [Chloroflexi bacterium]|nr:acetyl-CoA carboxylase biotin carboxyl carrier protein subunit [Chloroflexota bacterium]
MRRYRLTVGGRSVEIAVEELAADRFQVALDGQQYEVTLEALDAAHPTPVPLPQAQAAPPSLTAPPAAAAGILTAPLPGTVLTIEAVPGRPIRRGEPVLVLEAMKMQNIIRAPADAVVAEVLVAPGQAVGYGEPLVRFEAKGP